MASASSSTAPYPPSSTKSKHRKSKSKSKANPNPSQLPPPPQPKSDLPLVRYPPFPTIPPDAEPIIPYSQFKDYGIRLHGLPAENGTVSDIEVDGLGIPTVALRVRHDTDNCKTFTRGREQNEKLNQRKTKSSLKGSAVAEQAPAVTKKDPAARALERKKQRVLLFAKMEWYEQWAEGEAMRGTSVYDSNLTIVDRIHYAANDFRKGRIWPLGLSYLWDQFRLYVGLLGQPPVWYRTDLHQNPDDVVDGIDGDDEVLFEKGAAALNKADPDQKKEKSILDDDFYDDDSEGDEPMQTQPTSGTVEENQEKPLQRKRVPLRTPYALHNVVPIALSSDSQVKTLLAIASLRKYQKLESFIYTPETSIRIFLSWYLHHQGFIFSPGYLANLPRLVLFFLEFLVKTKAVYESERALKAAVEVTKKAITEVPAAGRMCRILPDKMGVGCMLHWGKTWVDEDQPFGFGDKNAEEAKREAMKKFEEELKKENVQVVPAEAIPPVEELKGFDEEIGEIDLKGDTLEAGISIQVLSPTSPGFPNPEEISTAFIEEVNEEHPILEKIDDRPTKVEEELVSAVQESSPSQRTAILTPIPESSTEATVDTHAASMTDEETSPNPASEMNQAIPSCWDTDPTPSQDKSKLDAWAPKVGQPLMDMLGMTVLPIKYKPAVAERSMRRVREVIPAGGKSKEAGMERRWRGVQQDLVGKLARVVLEPWLDWDDGGIAEAYRKPRVQFPQEEKRKSGEGEQLPPDTEEQKSGVEEHLHDAEKVVVTILIDPRVAEQISVGMGLAGTWIQMAKVQDYWKHAGLAVPDFSRREGQGFSGPSRGRGGGRGRGRGRGGATSGHNDDPLQKVDPDLPASVETTDQDSLPHMTSKDEVIKPEHGSSSPDNGTTSTQGGHRGGRGRGGRGRGGHHHHAGGAEKEFAFWYVEDIFVAIPSFWMAGKEEEPLVMPEGEEDVDLYDLED